MRIRDEGGVPFRRILEYWRIHGPEGADARRLRFRLVIMIHCFAHVCTDLPSCRRSLRGAVKLFGVENEEGVAGCGVVLIGVVSAIYRKADDLVPAGGRRPAVAVPTYFLSGDPHTGL